MARDKNDEALRDLLISISVIAKRLANKLEANQQPITDDDLLDFGGNEDGQDRTCKANEQCSRDVF